MKFILEELVKPLAGRLGSLAAGGLVGMGVNATHADQVAIGIAAAVLIAIDLITRKMVQVEKKGE